MASPGELIGIVADATGVDYARVFSVHRYLREAGQVTQGGRGSSAARMTFRDAANILIVLSTNTNVKDAAKVLATYGSLEADQLLHFDDAQDRGGTLADALATFLEIVPTTPPDFNWRDNHVTVRISFPVPSASIAFMLDGKNEHRQRFQPKRTEMLVGDMRFESVFTQISLGEIGAMIGTH
jgi:hypothetical protein